MSLPRVFCLLVSFGQVSGTVGQEFLLSPPRNLMLVSHDFQLFLTWLPASGDLPGVTYTVQWMEPYGLQWHDVLHCRDVSETVCNVTCMSPELDNRYSVQVKAQMKNSTGMASSKWVELNNIDYTVNVELAPPILQLKKTENALDVSIAFSYPSCAKATFQDLTYDLEYGIDGAGKPRNFTETKKNVLGFDTTHWSSGRYCFRARAFVSEKWSNYSKPVCTLLHEKAENWAFVAVPLLLMLPAGAFVVFCWYRNMNNQIKMPQALDFSKGPTKLLLIGERESIKLDSFTCTGALVESGRRNRTGPQIHSTLSPSVLSEENEEDEDDDSGSPIAYMEVLRFQKKSVNCQMASMCLEAPLPSSGYGSSQSGLPDLMVPGVPVSTEWVTGESSSGFQENEGTSSSESSSVEESLEFPVGFPTARGKEWDEDIDFSSVLIEGRGINLPTGKQFMPVRSHSEENCTSLEDLKIPLFGMLGNQDSCGLHFEEQFVDKRGSEKDCSGCGSLVDEIPLLGVPCRGALEPGLLGENRDLESGRIPEPKFHGYRPRHTHYIART
ncbi:interferon lambda receptor 1 isoform X2 [Zootoca vivipara]|uniref:interferon lambda receptor 1 isoform X2 n=1 Tax=Zootoca vivipara TaxID=8524 RepID=UPI001592A54A|nr:interferon lambda receptor 1 isoform X2 [Zootoca vivipara]